MNIRRQRGMGIIASIITIAVVVFFLYLIACLGPLYLENYSLQRSLRVIAEKDARQFPNDYTSFRNAIKLDLAKAFRVGDIKNVTPQDIELTNISGGVQVNIAYEARTHIIANIEALVSFKNSVKVKLNGG
ncbi:MAG: hypothetical protein CMF50_09615 [Legionellales bacterium]|nr:hypothetical protein [Legionellales bacterium]|tara:strand:- start:2845 stop:3237 length:393 start_codon:yes stop_codon:yes gene_type:complete